MTKCKLILYLSRQLIYFCCLLKNLWGYKSSAFVLKCHHCVNVSTKQKKNGNSHTHTQKSDLIPQPLPLPSQNKSIPTYQSSHITFPYLCRGSTIKEPRSETKQERCSSAGGELRVVLLG